MNNKNNIVVTMVSMLSGLILLALGILIGRSLQQPRFVVTDLAGEGSDNKQLLELGNTLKVRGHVSLPIKPEVAILNMGIEVCNPVARQVNQEVNERLESIIKELGRVRWLSDDAIVPTSFSMYPSSADGYCGVNKLSVFTDDLEQISNLIDLAIDAGVNRFYDVDFTIKDNVTAKQEVVELAFEDAERQAKQMADLLGQSLGEVIKSEIEIYDRLPSYPSGRGGGGAVVPTTQDGALSATVMLVYEVR